MDNQGKLREKYPHLFYDLLALMAIRVILKARRVVTGV